MTYFKVDQSCQIRQRLPEAFFWILVQVRKKQTNYLICLGEQTWKYRNISMENTGKSKVLRTRVKKVHVVSNIEIPHHLLKT